MANSLHYVEDQTTFIRACESHMTSPRRFLIVEYDTNEASRWLPYPVPQPKLIALFTDAGYSSIRISPHGPPSIGGLRSTPRWSRLRAP